MEKINAVINLLYIYPVSNERINYKRLPPQPFLFDLKTIFFFGNTHKHSFPYVANGRTHPDGGSASIAIITTITTLHEAPPCFGATYRVLPFPQVPPNNRPQKPGTKPLLE